MMKICSVPMLISKRSDVRKHHRRRLSFGSGLVLIELIVVIAILSIIVAIATLNLTGQFGQSEFRLNAVELINIMKMAQNAAAESNRRYAVVFDMLEQTYTLREIASQNLDIIPDEEAIIATGDFTEEFYLDNIVFDDGYNVMEKYNPAEMLELKAVFMAGQTGWQAGGAIILQDNDGNFYTIMVNRLNKVITLRNEAVDIIEIEALKPKEAYEVPF